MHEPYKSNNISCKNTSGVKKVCPSKVDGSEGMNRLVTTTSNIRMWPSGLVY